MNLKDNRRLRTYQINSLISIHIELDIFRFNIHYRWFWYSSSKDDEFIMKSRSLRKIYFWFKPWNCKFQSQFSPPLQIILLTITAKMNIWIYNVGYSTENLSSFISFSLAWWWLDVCVCLLISDGFQCGGCRHNLAMLCH